MLYLRHAFFSLIRKSIRKEQVGSNSNSSHELYRKEEYSQTTGKKAMSFDLFCHKTDLLEGKH